MWIFHYFLQGKRTCKWLFVGLGILDIHSFNVGIAASQKKPHLSAYASIRQHTPAYASIRQHTCMHSFAVRIAAVRGGMRRALRGRLIRLLSRGSLQQPFASLTKKRKIRGGKEEKGKRKKKGGEYLDIGLVRTVTSFSSGVGSCKWLKTAAAMPIASGISVTLSVYT